MIARLAMAAALGAWATLACAEPLYLTGTVGKAQVFATIERDSAGISGWYLYLRHGKQLRLTGKTGAGGTFTLSEYSPGGSVIAATFRGTVKGAQWTGMWQAAIGGPPVAFALSENHDVLAALSGNFRCKARQVDGELGWTWEQTLDLALARGRVSKFSTVHTARTMEGDEQNCGLGLSDLERKSSRTGILFRAAGDEAGTEGGHCSVRILTAGDYLYVKIGDTTEDGNDCRGLSDTMFCSPRGNWNDLVLNRKTGQCTMVQ